MNSDLVLVFPPHWGFDIPHISIPSLAASTRRAGFETVIRDLNSELLGELVSPPALRRACGRMNGQLRRLDPRRDSERIRVLEEHLAQADVIIEHLPTALATLCGSVEARAMRFAVNVTASALQLVSRAYHPAHLSHRDFTIDGRHATDLGVAMAQAQDDACNPYFEMIDDVIAASLLSSDPRAMGLSITSSTQLIPALTLARRIRKLSPHVTIVAGGALTFYMIDVIARAPEIFDLFDYFIFGEGETLLNHLLSALRQGRPPREMPGLCHRDSSLGPRLGEPEPIDELPTPDYSDLELKRYIAGGKVLPLLGSRGCPWGRCTFCGLNGSFHSCYRERSLELLLDDIDRVVRLTGTRHFSFNDESMSPGRVAALTWGLRERGVQINWDILARVDDGFTEEGLRAARTGGLTFMKWGLESGSPRVLRRMGKGIDVEVARKVFHRCARAGIWTHVFVIIGFPGETKEDYERTRDMLLREDDAIDSVSWAVFSCDKGAPLFRHPKSFGIRIEPGSDRHIGPEHDYVVLDGANREEVLEWTKDLEISLTYHSHLGSFHKKVLNNAFLFHLVDTVGREAARALIGQRSARFRRLLALTEGELTDLAHVGVAPFHVSPLSFPGSTRQERVLFHNRTGESVVVSEAGMRILSVLSQGGAVRDAIAAVASDRDLPVAEVAKGTLEFVHVMLLREGLSLTEPVEVSP